MSKGSKRGSGGRSTPAGAPDAAASSGAGEAAGGDYAGLRLGLPESGAGSLAHWGPRIVALVIDWVLANAAAYAVFRSTDIWQPPTTPADASPLIAFAVMTAGLVAILGSSIGHRVRHLQVVRLDGRQVGAWRAIVRTVLVLLVIPPLVVDADGRGLHDRAAGTILVTTR